MEESKQKDGTMPLFLFLNFRNKFDGNFPQEPVPN